MTPLDPKEFWLLYAGITIFALILFARKRARKGMRLRLKQLSRGKSVNGSSGAPPSFSHLAGANSSSIPSAERSLNVVFNYNGHSWDAYEVLGLPAGSSADKVDLAFKESLLRVDNGSRPFIEAAFQAIQEHVNQRKASSQN